MTTPPAHGRPGFREGPNGSGAAAPFPLPRGLPRPNPTTADADEDLMARRFVVELDFSEVIERHSNPIFGFIHFRTSCIEDAEDVFQELTLKAFRAWEALDARGRQNPLPWLFSIASNLLTDEYRRRARRPTTRVEVDALCAPTNSFAQVENHDEVDRLLCAAKLSELQAKVVALRCFTDLSEAETANCLGKTVPSVRTAFKVAKRKLRDAETCLQEHANETLRQAHKRSSRPTGMGR